VEESWTVVGLSNKGNANLMPQHLHPHALCHLVKVGMPIPYLRHLGQLRLCLVPYPSRDRLLTFGMSLPCSFIHGVVARI